LLYHNKLLLKYVLALYTLKTPPSIAIFWIFLAGARFIGPEHFGEELQAHA
jgi:hypothetical protein